MTYQKILCIIIFYYKSEHYFVFTLNSKLFDLYKQFKIQICIISGANIAEYAGKHLHKFITARPEYHLGNIEEALKQVTMLIILISMK